MYAAIDTYYTDICGEFFARDSGYCVFITNDLYRKISLNQEGCGARDYMYMTLRSETTRDEPEELEMMQNVAYGPLQLKLESSLEARPLPLQCLVLSG